MCKTVVRTAQKNGQKKQIRIFRDIIRQCEAF